MSYNIPYDKVAGDLVTAEDFNNVKNSIDGLKGGVAGDAPTNTVEQVNTLVATYSDHGNLSGLTDDDHTIYSLVDGSRDFTDKISYNNNKVFTDDADIVAKKYVDDEINIIEAARTGVYQNGFINGNFDIWQLGSSFTATGYTADQWILILRNNTETVSKQTFTPGQTDVPNEPTNFVRLACAGSGSESIFSHRIEDVRTYAGKTVTVSLYIKSDISSFSNSYFYYVQDFGSGGSADVSAGAKTISISSSWNRVTATISIPSISGKTIGTDSFLDIRFRYTPDSTGNIDIAQAMINLGSVALDFQPRHPAVELALCERYLQKSYRQDVAPGTASNYGAYLTDAKDVFELYMGPITFSAMRTNPTVMLYSTDGTSGKAYNTTTAANVDVIAIYDSNKSFLVYGAGGAFTATNEYKGHWVADARL